MVPHPIQPASELERRLLAALKTVYDPEIPVNIYDLGLIYELKVDPTGLVQVLMTLTNPMCPVAGSFPDQVAEALRQVEGVADAHVQLTFDPPWEKEFMSEEARVALDMW